jgi:hypothetical protein
MLASKRSNEKEKRIKEDQIKNIMKMPSAGTFARKQ